MKLGEAADWSINACVQRADECEFVKHPGTFNLMTSFFCGNDAVCHQVRIFAVNGKEGRGV